MRKILVLCVILFSKVSAESILRVIPLPGYSNGYYAYGLAFDGTNLWVGDDYDGMIYKLDTLGNVLGSFMGISGSNHGLAWDGPGLWCAGDYSSRYLIKFTPSGSRVDSVYENWDYIGGIGFMNGNILVSVYYPNTRNNIYVLNPATAQIVDTIPSPGTQPQGVTYDGQYAWVVMDDNDGDPERVWKIDPLTGDTLMSFPVPTTSPRGLVWDGNYLWLIARNPGGPGCAVFKIDPYGGETPEISVNLSSYDFGNVIIGEEDTFLLICTNTGNGNLVVDSIKHNDPAFSIRQYFPIILEPLRCCSILVVFSPTEYREYVDTLKIYSNDPLHPIVNVRVHGSGIYSGQDIELSDTMIIFPGVRVNGSKRRWLNVTNVGSSMLIIDSLKFSGESFFTTSSFPLAIEPTVSKALDIWFAPYRVGEFQETLYLYSNDPDESVINVYLMGSGIDTVFVGGDIIWYYQARGGSVYNHIRSIKSIPDVNGDGKPDVVAVSENDTLYLIHGNGYLAGDVLWTYGAKSCYTERGLIVVPDINGDGCYDVILGTVWGSRKVYAVSGKDGNVIWEFDTHIYGQGGWVYEVAYAPDLNNDGIMEILAAAGNDAYNTGPCRVFMLSGQSGEILWERYLGYSVFGVRCVGDINNDGYPEVAAGTGNGEVSAYWVYLLDGRTGSFIWNRNLSGACWTVVPLQDVNNDGVSDLACGLGNGQIMGLSGLNGNPIWTFNTGGMVIELNVMEDVNGDGYYELLPAGAAIYDFIAVDSRTGNSIWRFSSGHQVFSLVEIPDINGDDYNDVVGGTGYNVNRLVLIDGPSGNVIWNKTMQSAVEAVYPIEDIDGDGSWDILAGLRNGDILCIASGNIVSLREDLNASTDLSLLSSNFMKDVLSVRLSVNKGGRVRIAIYNSSGQCVKILEDREFPIGTYKFSYPLGELKSGIYFLRVSLNEESKVLKIVYIK